jgi:hypothetical protein
VIPLTQISHVLHDAIQRLSSSLYMVMTMNSSV